MTDLNATIAFLLNDLAAIQESTQSQWGYRRAAHAILMLEEPIASLVQPDGSLPGIRNVGPKSLRVVREVLASGASPTVEDAVRASGKAAEIATRRSLRRNFLSRARVLAVLRDDQLAGPSSADHRADFQMHSDWSDGTEPLARMAQGCLARGYRWSAVTDHARGRHIARGLSAADLIRQREEIDRVNQQLEGQFRMLAGVEANIGPDGSIGFCGDELPATELVVAAPHADLRSLADQTVRMTTAVETPGVHILGHPRGRQRGSRAGIAADWDRVFAAAASTRVAIEIDGDPARQDIDFELAARACELGCLFALDSDAHSADQLGYADVAIAHARLAGVPAERVINCWPLDRLEDWLEERRKGA